MWPALEVRFGTFKRFCFVEQPDGDVDLTLVLSLNTISTAFSSFMCTDHMLSLVF